MQHTYHVSKHQVCRIQSENAPVNTVPVHLKQNSQPFYSVFFVLFLVAAVSALPGCSGSDSDNDNNRNTVRPPTVEAIQVTTGSLPLEERLTGLVRARNQTDIYAEISAPITRVLVNNGDFVEQGQVLIELRDTEARERLRHAESGVEIARAQVRQAQAELNRRTTALSRIRQLYEQQLETRSALENAEAETESADAALALQQAQLNQALSIVEERKNDLAHTLVRAPVDGFVGLRNAETGQIANPSTRLFQIGDTSRMRIEMVLTEDMTSYIAPGQTALVFAGNSQQEPLETEITRISPFLNPVTHTTTAEIELDNPDNRLRPGMYVTVSIQYGASEHAILLPNNALYNHPNLGQQGVFLAERVGQELPFEGERPPGELLGPAPVQFVPVEVVARGRQISGITGIPNDSWVVSLGHDLLLRGSETAFIRTVDWDHILDLQLMHSRDLFEIIRQKLASQPSPDNGDA